MIAIHIEKVKNIQKKYAFDLEDQQKKALKKLKDLKKSKIQLSTDEKNYLDLVINLFERQHVLLSSPDEIEFYKTLVGQIPINSRKSKKLKPLKKFIIEKLDYKELRSSFYPKYFNDIGVKACVYCNSSLTISVEKTLNNYSARFDVDHYEPKDEFPFLSIFLFNLYPACASCNRRKGKSTKIKFKLYSEKVSETTRSEYKFKLEIGAKSKFLLTKDVDDLKFTFEPLSNLFQSELKIQEIYNTQKDLIEELIAKQAMYDKYNRRSLYNSFSKLKLHPDLYLRTLIGNYIKENEIHKRPMAKFTQDIAKQLGLI